MTRRTALALLAVLVVLLTACSDKPTEAEFAKADDGNDPRLVYIMAPGSFTPMLEALGKELTKTHRDISLVLVSDTTPIRGTPPTSTPAARIKAGARPSLWIDTAQIIKPFQSDPAVKDPPVDLGTDALRFVVPTGNPRGIESLTVFGPETGPRTAICNSVAPCGRGATTLLNKQGITPKPDLVSTDGVQLMQDLAAGKIETGLVYATDVAASGIGVSDVPYPDESTNVVAYQMVRFTDRQSAIDFSAWVATSPEARAILSQYGLVTAAAP